MNRVNHSSKTTTTAKPILRILSILAILVQTIAFTACSSDDGKDDGDEGGGNYKTTEIGTQIWMAENLNIAAEGSKCYNDDSANCAQYGRLYNWASAMKACPKGWHLPSDEDWDALEEYIEDENRCSNCAAKHLKATSGWDDWEDYGTSGNGLDTYGFAALPGGAGGSDGDDGDAGSYGRWWSASPSEDPDRASYRIMPVGERLIWNNGDKTFMFSVRCVKN